MPSVTIRHTLNVETFMVDGAREVLKRRSQEAAVILAVEVSAGARHGIHYPGLPRRSSAIGEPEQEQSGALLESVDSRPDPNSPTGAGYVFGFFDHDYGKLRALELNPESRTYRGTLLRLGSDPEFRRSLEEIA